MSAYYELLSSLRWANSSQPCTPPTQDARAMMATRNNFSSPSWTSPWARNSKDLKLVIYKRLKMLCQLGEFHLKYCAQKNPIWTLGKHSESNASDPPRSLWKVWLLRTAHAYAWVPRALQKAALPSRLLFIPGIAIMLPTPGCDTINYKDYN